MQKSRLSKNVTPSSRGHLAQARRYSSRHPLTWLPHRHRDSLVVGGSRGVNAATAAGGKRAMGLAKVAGPHMALRHLAGPTPTLRMVQRSLSPRQLSGNAGLRHIKMERLCTSCLTRTLGLSWVSQGHDQLYEGSSGPMACPAHPFAT